MGEYQEIYWLKPILKASFKEKLVNQIINSYAESLRRSSNIIDQTVNSIVENIDDSLIERIITARNAATEATRIEEKDRLLTEISNMIITESNKAGEVFANVVRDAAMEAITEIIDNIRENIGNKEDTP